MALSLFVGSAVAASAGVPDVDTGILDDLVATPDGYYLYTVGFHATPSLAPGDDFHGAEVLMVNTAIDFVSVRTQDPVGFELRAKSDPEVRYVNADQLDALRPHYTPNDPRIVDQWGWDPTPGVDGYGAWDVSMGSTATIVAVLDTGLEKSHEDIGNYLQGYDFASGDNDPDDRCGHGTHVAGTVGALTDNGVGVAGAAQTTLLPVKVLDKGMFGSCSGSFSAIANGITYAADQGADVISMSLGCDSCSDQSVIDALDYAWKKGALNVCSAGNANGDPVGFPANDPNCMAVSSIDQSGQLSSFSSKGPEVEIAAPGSNILSTYTGNGYATLDGTSMAAPHVSGVAALTLAVNSLSNSQLRNHLKSTAVDLGLASDEQGAGALNACNAVGSTTCGSGSGGGGGGGDATMHVHDITHKRKGSPRNGDLEISVFVYDGAESGVNGVSTCIEVTQSGGPTASGCGSTSSTGEAAFVWSGIGGGTYTTCVTDLTKSGYTWDTSADHASSGNCHTSSV